MSKAYYLKPDSRWLFSYESGDIVGFKDPDGSENLFVYTVPNTEPVYALQFATTGSALGYCDGDPDKGTIWWCPEDDTFSIQHSNGVRQQVGEEIYMRALNDTGSAIPNGTIVGFAGTDETGYIEVSPYIADGSLPILYSVGVATETIEAGAKGRITVWGRVRDVDTTDWNIGDILYASPTVSGGMTNVKPTAPQFAIPVAAVLVKDEAGEIFVRPTIEQAMHYGACSRNTDLAPAAADTAYAIALDTTELSNGVSIVDNTKVTAANAGIYSISITAQLMSSSASAKNVWFWMRKNGTDVTYSSRITTMNLNGGYRPLALVEVISLEAGDYIEVMWAVSDTAVTLKAAAATAFAPASPALQVVVTQTQQ